jgi:hypothetical protein
LDPDGSFAFALPTLGLSDVFYLRIAVTDSYGRSAEQVLCLLAEIRAPRPVPPLQAEKTEKTEKAAAARIIPPQPEPVEEEAAATVVEEEIQVPEPVLLVQRPEEGAYLSSELVISGKLLDSAGGVFPATEVESLRWELEGSELQGELAVDDQGRFKKLVDAVSLRRDALLILRATMTGGRTAEQSVPLRADVSAPLLEVQTPKEGAFYEDSVVVQGSAADNAPVLLRWRILGAPGLSGELSLPKEGTFRFEIPTRSLEGIQIVELRAEDQPGNASVSTVTLAGREPVAEVAEPVVPAAREPLPPPRLIIESPPDRSYYHSRVVVRGRILRGDALTWEIPGSGLSGTGIIGQEGRFSLEIPTEQLQGTRMLRLVGTGSGGQRVEKVITLLDHERGPEIKVKTPENRSYYRTSIPLEGSVGNPADDWDSVGEVAGFSLRVAGREDPPMEIPFDEEGRFRVDLSAQGFSGKQTLILTAEDKNGDAGQAILTLLDGNLNPSVSIHSPLTNQLYGSRIRVSGKVIDPYAGSAAMEGIESVAYNVTSPEVFALAKSVPGGTVELGEDKSFDFVVNTRELSGPQDVTILVRGRSGNQTEASVRILEGAADLPVFSVEAGDRRAVLRWDPLPSAASYTLSYRTENPAERRGREVRIDGVSSPYVLLGLENGNRYVFQVRAVVPGEADSASEPKWAIPLSGETLRPVVRGEFEQIRISWPSIPGSRRYVLWRSTKREGGYTPIAEALPETNYVDKAVQYGRSYFYRVTPAEVPEFASRPVLGESTAFPVEKLKSAGLCPLNQARRISLFGGYAFVAGGGEGIKIIDITSPDNPALVGGLGTADAHDVAVRGEYAFVADGERGLKVLDISDPRSPAEIGMRKTMDARAVAIRGDTAFIADGSSGVKIIDLSSPVQPSRIGSYATENACDLLLHEGRLYLADGAGGMKILEISDTSELTQVQHLPGLDVRSVAVEGSLLYLAAGAQGLIIFDISGPGTPVEVGRYTATEILDVGVSGTFAYLVDSREGMIVVDVSDPSRPWRFADFSAENASSVVVRGHYAYLSTPAGLQVVHILIQGRSVPIAAGAAGGKAYNLSVAGARAYVACHDLGIRIVDISDPTGLGDDSVIGAWSGDYAVDIEVADTVAFVTGGRRGLSIIDLSPAWDDDPRTQPVRIGSYYTGGTAYQAAIHSGLLFVADGGEGLKVLDITIPGNPVEIGSAPGKDVRDVAIIPGYALIADAESGLIVCDISDPGVPVPIRTVECGGAHRVVAQDTLVAAAGRSGVQLYDFSDPSSPQLVDRFESAYVESIFIHGPYLYIAEGYRGLQVVDIRSFDRPVQVSACPGIYAVDVAVFSGYAFVTDSRKIHVVEVLIPEWLRHSSSGR